MLTRNSRVALGGPVGIGGGAGRKYPREFKENGLLAKRGGEIKRGPQPHIEQSRGMSVSKEGWNVAALVSSRASKRVFGHES